jgi:hypothetical protein
MAVIGDREWVAVRLEMYRALMADDHKRGRTPPDVQRFLADEVWDRIAELYKDQVVWLSPYKPVGGEPSPIRGSGYEGGLDLPDKLIDCMVIMAALRRLHADWSDGYAAVKRSLSGQALASDAKPLSRAKFRLAARILEVQPIAKVS